MTLMTDTDKLVSIKGLVIRATPVIPDMKLGMSRILSGPAHPLMWRRLLQLSSDVWSVNIPFKRRSIVVESTSPTSVRENNAKRRGQ